MHCLSLNSVSNSLPMTKISRGSNLDINENLIHKSYDSKTFSYSLGFESIEDINTILESIEETKIVNFSIDKPTD